LPREAFWLERLDDDLAIEAMARREREQCQQAPNVETSRGTGRREIASIHGHTERPKECESEASGGSQIRSRGVKSQIV